MQHPETQPEKYVEPDRTAPASGEDIQEGSSRCAGDAGYEPGNDGIFRLKSHRGHRNEEYSESGFDVLLRMQSRHFWYRGRHRFLLAAVRRAMSGRFDRRASACDLGGGCGGWLQYLNQHAANQFGEVALADSSLRALQYAETVVGPNDRRYQIDLMHLNWQERWDVAFLLDVLEHIPDDLEALRQIKTAMKPGGLLFVTTPALQFFWSYNDTLAHHQRRYSKRDYALLAEKTGLKLVDARYFMFFLSPLLFLSRKKHDLTKLSDEEARELMARAHRVPAPPINETLATIFAAETPIGHWLPFPWGTSILGIFRKPVE